MAFAALQAAACAASIGDRCIVFGLHQLQPLFLQVLSARVSQSWQCMGRYAAINKPVVLLPGVNHAQLSTGVMKDGAFDLKPEDLGRGPATEVVAESLGQFLLAHRSQDRHALLILFALLRVEATALCRQ